MGVLWHKIWFDLWRNKLRTLLVILSIAVGVFAVGATFGMVEQMLPTMDAAHVSTDPSHGTMYFNRPVDRDTILALQDIPGVEAVEAATEISIRYKIRPTDKWKTGMILARDDYEDQTYDQLQLKAGAWPEGRFLAIERMHSPFYGLDIGDEVIIEADGKEQTFKLTGKIRHPFVPPPNMYDMAWFFGGEDVMEMFGIPKGTFNALKFRAAVYSATNAKIVASAIKERLAKQDIGVEATVYQDPEKHWGRAFIDGMSMVTQVLAVLSMLLSIVLVLNTLTALISQQTNQIGILKAIGGSGFTIVKVYLTGVLVYGVLALLVALPLGSLASYSITRSFLGLYNIDYDQFAVSNRAIAVQALAALVVPLFAGLIPVLQGAAISVRQAIASYGLGGDFGSSWIDRAVERIGRTFLVSYYAMALANTFRRKARLALTQLVLVTAGAMFLMVMSLSSSMASTLDVEFDRRQYDILVSFSGLQRVDRVCAVAETVGGVEHAGMWLIAPATVLHNGERSLDAGVGSELQGIPVEDPMYAPQVVAGRWLQPSDDRVVVMNKDTAEDENIGVGDTITLDLGPLGKDNWQVVGLYQTFLFFGGGFSVDAIYAPRQAVFEATKKTGRGTTLLVRTQQHGAEEVEAVARALEDVLEANNIKIDAITRMPVERNTSEVSFSYVTWMLMTLACIVALVGGIGLMGAMWIGVIERTKEIGILRAIGAVSPIITRMFILEGIVQGFLSWLIAVPLSALLTPVMAEALGRVLFGGRLSFSYNLPATLIWLAIVLTISILASLIPARNAAGINVRQSLSYE